MSTRPQILYLCSAWPHDRSFGGQLRALHLARALRDVGDVTVTVVNPNTDIAAPMARTAKEFAVAAPIHPLLAPNAGLVQKLRWALDARYLNVHGTIAPAHERRRLMSSLGQYDLVWVLNARLPNILQRWHWPRAHLDVDDIPSVYLRALGRSAGSAVARWKARTQRVLLHRREQRFNERFTTVSVCSDADRAYLGARRVHVIPNGFERPIATPARQRHAGAPRLGFIGLYSYPPNLDGMRWFFRDVWPQIRAAVPGIRFQLIGKDTDGTLRPDAPDVDVHGWVADPAAEIATWSVMVIPVRMGGGTRIKIADAFSRKCPVVSTTFGAYGYEVRDREQLRLADDATDFANACIDLVRHPLMGEAMAERAWRDFLQKWTWDAIAPKVHAAAEDCLRRSDARAAAN